MSKEINKKTYRKVDFKVIDGLEGKRCTGCNEWKVLGDYSAYSRGVGGKRSKCKICDNNYRIENREEILAYKRKWREENYERSLLVAREWKFNNKDKMRLIDIRRRARIKSLPDTWSNKQKEEMQIFFNYSCAITGEKGDVTLDHAIPLIIGHGGTVHGNMYPLVNYLNFSKQDKNIFEWFEANRQRFELSQDSFDNLISYLASANAMTVEEYRDHVYWCHANPRNINELEAN